MIKIHRFKLKSKGSKAVYKGFAIKIWIFKFERISLGRKFMWRFELAYGWDK